MMWKEVARGPCALIILGKRDKALGNETLLGTLRFLHAQKKKSANGKHHA